MNSILILFDVAPSAGLIGGVATVAFFFVLLGVAFVAFLALKKTLKMAFRLAIVAVILVIAVAGSIALLYFSYGSSGGPRPRPTPPVNGRR